MVDHCSPFNWAYLYQDEGIEELRHYLFCKTELEAAILTAREELSRREIEILHLKDVLCKTIKERNEAQAQCQQLMLNKIVFQQQILQNQEPAAAQQHHQVEDFKQEVLAPACCSSDDESKGGGDHMISSSSRSSPDDDLEVIMLKLPADKPLPEKGKLLQAVKEAGPLLQTLLLAGPLPQWQHPPPPLDSVEIPLVTISSPTARPVLLHQESFNTSSSSSLSKKRDLEFSDPVLLDSCSPTSCNKYPKIGLH